MTGAELIRRGARHFGDRTAVVFGDQRLTYAEVDRSANRLAHVFRDLGLKKGDRVAFLLANSVHSIEIDFAVLKAGLVRVPLNTRLALAEHRHMVQETGARLLIFSREFQARAGELREGTSSLIHLAQVGGGPVAEWALDLDGLALSADADEPGVVVREDDLATLQYTSGTTGVLKAAMHTQGTWAAIALNILTNLRIERDDVMLHAAPLTHAAGTLVLPHWVRGAVNAVLPGFRPREYLEAVDRLQPTTLNLVPTMIVMLLAEPEIERYSFASVRQIIYGASPMPTEALRRGIALWGKKFVQYYGQTESPLILTLLEAEDHDPDTPDGRRRLGSCGRAVPTAELRIVDEDGRDVPPGETGEIAVRSSQNMVGYWQAPALTAETIVDGWIRTRDMGYQDADGFVYLVDRKSDMIITGGFNVYPREVEDVLYRHPAVLEAAVIGVPDPQWGEAIKAFVVLRPGHQVSEAELIAFCRDHLASYKKPKSVEFVASLPKSPVDKVLRRVLREPFWEGRDRRI
jgi:acyl-CoA synthetase (AMP-forming)/AMP-acid ligase II